MQKEGAAEDSDGDALEKGAENGEKKRRGRPKKAAEAPAKKKARGRPSKKDIKKTDDSDDGDSMFSLITCKQRKQYMCLLEARTQELHR